MNPATTTPVFELISGGLGVIIVTMLGYLIAATNALRADLNAHVLDMAQKLAEKISKADCAASQKKCVALNDVIIKEPLEKADKALWAALKHHTHRGIDDNGEVIIREGRDGSHG